MSARVRSQPRSRRLTTTGAAVAALVVAGAVLRFVAIGDQSFWRDEASTVIDVHGSFGHLWSRLVDLEGTPPLYFVLAWLWAKVFGTSEAALRSLSALFGIATIPIAAALARRLAPLERRHAATILGAALAAASPFLVWYAQEGRAYALLALLTAAATLAFVRRDLWLWGALTAAALGTHWFAALLLAPQAAVLVWQLRRRALPALVLPAVACVLLAPLLIAQRDARVDWVSTTSSLATRTADVAKHWAAGPFGTPADLAGAAAVAALVAGVLLAAAATPQARRLLAVVVASLALPVVLAVFGLDYVFDRYLIGALVPALALAAAGFARRPPALAAGGAVLAAALLAFTIDNATDDARHREDWRAVAAGLGRAPAAVVVSEDGEPPLEVYVPGIRAASGAVPVRAVVLAASWRFGRERPATPPPPPGFALAGRRELPTATVVRYTAPAPQPVDPAALAALTLRPDEPARVLVRP